MINGLGASISGLNASIKKVETASNNLANLNTPGYKNRQTIQQTSATGGTQVAAITTSRQTGGLIQTDNPLDLSILGQGFFGVALANGNTGFTRGGTFSRNAQGQLADVNGNPIQPPIAIPGNATAVSIGKDGTVSALVNGASNPLGQINVSNFQNPSGLEALGGNLFSQSGASGAPLTGAPGAGGRGEILSGFLEASNVDIAKESVNLITSQAAFRASINAIKTQGQMIGAALDLKT